MHTPQWQDKVSGEVIDPSLRTGSVVRAGGPFAVEGVRGLSIVPAGLKVHSVAEYCKTSHLDAATLAGTAGTWIA